MTLSVFISIIWGHLNEARGGAGTLIWDETGTTLLKLTAVPSGKRFITVQYIYPTILKFFGNPAQLGVSFTCDPTLK